MPGVGTRQRGAVQQPHPPPLAPTEHVEGSRRADEIAVPEHSSSQHAPKVLRVAHDNDGFSGGVPQQSLELSDTHLESRREDRLVGGDLSQTIQYLHSGPVLLAGQDAQARLPGPHQRAAEDGIRLHTVPPVVAFEQGSKVRYLLQSLLGHVCILIVVEDQVSRCGVLLGSGGLESSDPVEPVDHVLQGDVLDALGMPHEEDLLHAGGQTGILPPGEELKQREGEGEGGSEQSDENEAMNGC